MIASIAPIFYRVDVSRTKQRDGPTQFRQFSGDLCKRRQSPDANIRNGCNGCTIHENEYEYDNEYECSSLDWPQKGESAEWLQHQHSDVRPSLVHMRCPARYMAVGIGGVRPRQRGELIQSTSVRATKKPGNNLAGDTNYTIQTGGGGGQAKV